MMLPAYNPLARLGEVRLYNADQPPDAETIAILAAQGHTVQLVDRAAHNEELSLDYQNDPYLAGGGNPLYRDPANIPLPPELTMLNCAPTNSECVEANMRTSIIEQTLVQAWRQAQSGAYDPTAPDRYVAMLNHFQATGTLPAGTAPGNVNPLGPAPAVAPAYVSPTQPTGTQPAAPQTIVRQPAIQPTVATGGQAQTVTPPKDQEGQILPGVPSWALLAAAGGAAFLFLGGRR
jgi:hypothetical protein